MAGRAGGQGFSAAARAENKIFLHRRTATWAWPGCRLGLNLPHARLRRLEAGIMGDVMQRVMSAHWLLPPLVDFTITPILNVDCERSVKRGYRLYEERGGRRVVSAPAFVFVVEWIMVWSALRRNAGSSASQAERCIRKRGRRAMERLGCPRPQPVPARRCPARSARESRWESAT